MLFDGLAETLSSSHCLRFTFVCAMVVIMNFYNFSMLLFIFFVSLFGSICTLGLSFPEIFAIWFLCVAFVPTKEKKVNLHTKGSDNDDGFWASNPSTPLCAGRKLIFRRISHFTSVRRLYIFLVVLSLQSFFAAVCEWKFEYISVYVVGSSAALFLVDYISSSLAKDRLERRRSV